MSSAAAAKQKEYEDSGKFSLFTNIFSTPNKTMKIAYESVVVELEEARIELEQSLQSCVKLKRKPNKEKKQRRVDSDDAVVKVKVKVKVKAKRLELSTQMSKKSVPPVVLVALATEGNTSVAMGLDYFGGTWGVPSK